MISWFSPFSFRFKKTQELKVAAKPTRVDGSGTAVGGGDTPVTEPLTASPLKSLAILLRRIVPAAVVKGESKTKERLFNPFNSQLLGFHCH